MPQSFYHGAFACIFAASLAIRLYYQRKARSVARIEERAGARHRFWYWMVAASYIVMAIWATTPLLDFAQIALPDSVRLAGVALAAVGVLLLFLTHRALGANWSGVLEIAKEHRLVVSGVYRWVRHPMYTAFFATALGYALLSANAVAGGVAVGVTTLMYLARVRDEEAMMIDRFGDEYRAYMRRTGRLLPRLGA